MEELVLDGKSFVKASKAAKDLGYATDYVGQLCRSGKVDAHLIGRTWYVNPDQLGTHRVEKKRMSRVKAREYAKKSIEEHRLKVQETQNPYKNIDIQYEQDAKELIPETRKLSIQSESKYRIDDDSEEVGDEEEILNEGNKVLMSGSIDVVDVTDGPLETDTITLSPTRIRHSPVDSPVEVSEDGVKPQEEEADSTHSIEVVTEDEQNQEVQITKDESTIAPIQSRFIERLHLEEESTATTPVEEVPKDLERLTTKKEKGNSTLALVVIIIVLLGTTFSTTLSVSINYTALDGGTINQNLLISVVDTIAKISNKI